MENPHTQTSRLTSGADQVMKTRLHDAPFESFFLYFIVSVFASPFCRMKGACLWFLSVFPNGAYCLFLFQCMFPRTVSSFIWRNFLLESSFLYDATCFLFFSFLNSCIYMRYGHIFLVYMWRHGRGGLGTFDVLHFSFEASLWARVVGPRQSFRLYTPFYTFYTFS